MLISLKWLKKYVDLPKNVTAEDIALKLTMGTVEIDEVIYQAKSLEKIVVGKVLNVKPHPGADKLKLAEVDVGDEKLNIVCGGSNLKVGMMGPVALIGAKVKWHGQGEPVVMEKVKIRGEASEGMICTSVEIGLLPLFAQKEDTELLDLSGFGFEPGQSLAEALKLDDVIFDIDNKSLTNRPDLWGHHGLAREVAAIFKSEFKYQEFEKIKVDEKTTGLEVNIEAKDLCSRYMGIVMDNIKIAESPDWLKSSLLAVGLRPINNIVDITNYVLLDLGQPMHAFDADKLADKSIFVRQANKGEKLMTLDEEEKELDDSMLVIADKNKPIALAGVIGGLDTAVSEQTQTIIFEAATFNDYNIRQTSHKLGVRTESSIRVEKNLDPQLAALGICQAVKLVKELIPQARVVSELTDEQNFSDRKINIEVDYNFIIKRIGQKIENKEMVNILTRLGFEVKEKKDNMKITVPSWRATKDVSIGEDIVEEVARIYGYDNIEPQMPKVELALPITNELRKIERKIKQLMTLEQGFTETYQYSLISQELMEKTGLNYNDCIKLENSLSTEHSALRTSLIPGILQGVYENQKFFDQIRLFEIGRTYLNQPGKFEMAPGSKKTLPKQDYQLVAAYAQVDDDAPFYTAKQAMESLLAAYNVDYSLAAAEPLVWAHPYRYLVVKVDNQTIGQIAEIHPAIAQNFEIKGKISIMQLNLNLLQEVIQPAPDYQPIAKFPSIEADISLIVDDKVMYKDIEQTVLVASKQLIKKVELFDIYKDDKIGVGKKSLAIRVTYQANDRTLTKDEVEKLHQSILGQLEKGVGATIRK